MSLGHAASQAPVVVQAPKPSASIAPTIRKTRSLRSTCPCGNKAMCETFADVKRAADAFLQAATQAPQPMQVADDIASSESAFGTKIALASTGLPAF
ncbi:hypothetical protein D3C72_2245230 [compost metagenome]